MKKEDLIDKFCDQETSEIIIIYKNDSSGKKKLNMQISFKESKRVKPIDCTAYYYLCDDKNEDNLVKKIIEDYLNDDGNIIKVNFRKSLPRNPGIKAIEIFKDNKSKLTLGSREIGYDFSYVYNMLLIKKREGYYNYAIELINKDAIDNIIITSKYSIVSSIRYWEGDGEYLIKRLKNKYPQKELEYIVPKLLISSSTINKYYALIQLEIDCIINILKMYIEKYSENLLYTLVTEESCLYQFKQGRILIDDKYLIERTMPCYQLANNIIGIRANNKNKTKRRNETYEYGKNGSVL